MTTDVQLTQRQPEHRCCALRIGLWLGVQLAQSSQVHTSWLKRSLPAKSAQKVKAAVRQPNMCPIDSLLQVYLDVYNLMAATASALLIEVVGVCIFVRLYSRYNKNVLQDLQQYEQSLRSTTIEKDSVE